MVLFIQGGIAAPGEKVGGNPLEGETSVTLGREGGGGSPRDVWEVNSELRKKTSCLQKIEGGERYFFLRGKNGRKEKKRRFKNQKGEGMDKTRRGRAQIQGVGHQASLFSLVREGTEDG